MRKTARLLLKHRWGLASLTTLLMLISTAVLPLPYLFLSEQFALPVSIFLLLFVTVPVLIGYSRWCAKLEFDKAPHLLEIFYFFTTPKRYLKSLFAGTILFLRNTVVGVVFMLPPAAFFILADWLERQPQNDMVEIFVKNCLFLGAVASVVFSILVVIVTAKTMMSAFFVAVDDNLPVLNAVKKSPILIREKGGYLLKTALIILPLSFLVLPVLILIPYSVIIVTQCAKNC